MSARSRAPASVHAFEWIPPGPNAYAYQRCDLPVCIIQGPVGSGKTLASFAKFLRHAQEQAPNRSGVRATRWVFARENYGELEATTYKTFTEIFPEGDPRLGGWGHIIKSPPKVYEFEYAFRDEKGVVQKVEAEIHFMAFEDEDDVKKLKSMEITGFFVNELQFFPREAFDVLYERCRWPDPFKQGVAPTWLGGFADMNAPMSLHWVPIIRGDISMPRWFSEDERAAHSVPRGDDGRPLWAFFVQPPGLIEVKDQFGAIRYETNRGQSIWPDGPEKGRPMPAAENLENLERVKPGYYEDKAKGRSRIYVETQLMGRPAAQRGGKPVHPDYNDSRHFLDALLRPALGSILWVGIDFGLHFAAVFAQKIQGQWRFLHELYLEEPNWKAANAVRALIFEEYPDHARTLGTDNPLIRLYGDPSGDFGNRSGQNDFDVFRNKGLVVFPAPGGNRFEPKEGQNEAGSFRKSAMDYVLVHDAGEGRPGVVFTQGVPLLREAMKSGYVWDKQKIDGVETSKEKPVKNVYSHIAEAAQYLLLGGGAGAEAIGRGGIAKKVSTLRHVNPFDRGARVQVMRR